MSISEKLRELGTKLLLAGSDTAESKSEPVFEDANYDYELDDAFWEKICSDIEHAEKMIREDLSSFGGVQNNTLSFIEKAGLYYKNGVLFALTGEPEDMQYFVDESAITKAHIEAGSRLIGDIIPVIKEGVPCGLNEKRIEPGYILTDGTVLLQRERDEFGYFYGGAGMDGMYLRTNEFYMPVFDAERALLGFQQCIPHWKKDALKAYAHEQTCSSYANVHPSNNIETDNFELDE